MTTRQLNQQCKFACVNLHQFSQHFSHFRFVEFVLTCGIVIGFVVSYQNKIVAKIITIIHPNEDFETTIIPGIISLIASFSSLFLQLIFRLFVYFNLTSNSSNLMSLKSVTVLFFGLICSILSNNIFSEFAIERTYTFFLVKTFLAPLIMILDNEELKTHIKVNNQRLLNKISGFISFIKNKFLQGLRNTIPIFWQLFQLLLTKLTHSITLIKNIFCDPSNQIAPVEMIELQDIV